MCWNMLFLLSSPAGLRSGFITLPRLSRLDQSFAETSELLSEDSRRSSLPENSDVSMTRSDSLSSFTVDLGPSLMSEVLELIDSSCCLITSRQEEEEEPSSVFEMDHNGLKTEALVRRPITANDGIEPMKFQQAASMLTRHFGGGRPEEERASSRELHQRASSFRHTRTPYSFTEADEEIKVWTSDNAQLRFKKKKKQFDFQDNLVFLIGSLFLSPHKF